MFHVDQVVKVTKIVDDDESAMQSIGKTGVIKGLRPAFAETLEPGIALVDFEDYADEFWTEELEELNVRDWAKGESELANWSYRPGARSTVFPIWP